MGALDPMFTTAGGPALDELDARWDAANAGFSWGVVAGLVCGLLIAWACWRRA